MKKCTKCQVNKDFLSFKRMRASKDGLTYYCSACIATRDKIRYDLKREHILEQKIAYTKSHSKEKKLYNARYYLANSARIIQHQTEYERKRLKTDTALRMIKNLRRRLNFALKGQVKAKTTVSLIGCTTEFLRKYLEDRFSEGMNWDNYGIRGWHIDHIKPCSLFDLSKIEEQEVCFHYTNLQPLWASDNIAKSNKIL